MALGPLLKRYRQAKGLSQRELGRQAHVRQALISELETGKSRDAHAQILLRLANVLGVTLLELLGEESRSDQRYSPHTHLVWETVRA